MRQIKFPLAVGIIPILCMTALSVPAQAQERTTVHIGFVIDGPWERNEPILQLFQNEIADLLKGDFDVQFLPEMTLTGDFSPQSVTSATDRLLADPEVDLIISLGLLASVEAGRRDRLAKPIVAPFVMESRAQGVPLENGASGIHNLSYLESPATLSRELRTFQEIVPFKKLAFLSSPFFLEEARKLSSNVRAVAEELGIDVAVIGASGAAADVLDAVPPDTDAAYMVPLQQLDPGEFEALVRGLHERGIPTFSFLGRRDVELGVMAGLASGEWLNRVARRVALNAQRILLGEEAGDIPVSLRRLEELVINMGSARDIGIYPSFRVLTEAVLINDVRTEIDREIDLLDAVREAMAANRDLAAAHRDVAAGEKEVSRARSELLPQVDFSALGTVIDEDRAESSFGSVSERTLSGTVSFRQLLWSEKAWANLSVQKDLQDARKREFDELQLDVAFSAATSYLDLLRAKTFEQIQKDNLKLSRSNLELAQIRESIGLSGPSEVYRWQSQIAAEQKSVIEANSQRNVAEIALNRVLNRPLEEPFLTKEANLDDPGLVTSDPRFLEYMGNPWSFRVFRRFMVEEGLSASPEIQALDAAIEAQERLSKSTRRSFYSPTFALQGEVSRRFAEGGAGSDVSLPEEFGAVLGEADDTDWNVSLSLSIPLTDGGGRIADVQQATEKLRVLRIQRKALEERIEQRIRSAFHLAGASYAGISLARESADAALRNLNLVQDAYTKGVVQIIDLLDAQNATLIAEQSTANAVHDFLIDLMEVERAIGRFTFFTSQEELDAWFERLERYFQEARRAQ